MGTNFAARMRALAERDLAVAMEVFLCMWLDGAHRRPSDVDPELRERVREMATHAF
jgi:hypothetical protein